MKWVLLVVGLMFAGCAQKDVVYVDRHVEVKVPVKCEIPLPEKPIVSVDALFEIAKKQARTYELGKIIVEVDGYTLDADETSQERMNRACTMLADGATKEWKDANNEWQNIPKETFKNAVIAAGTKQTELWVKYA